VLTIVSRTGKGVDVVAIVGEHGPARLDSTPAEIES
jgi:hypothetical protein